MLKRLLFLSLFTITCSIQAQFSGNALDFDGTDDMVVSSTVPSIFSNPATNDFTIEAWVNPRGSLFARILYAEPSTTNFVSLGTNTGNTIYFYVIANGTTYSSATTTSITQNQWTHVAARWNSSTQTTEVLFNGVLQASVAGGTSSTGTAGIMTLGTRPGGGTQYFNGALDEVRVWSEARTDCEIQNNMYNSITGTQTNLVVNYNFNQGTGGGTNAGVTTLPDISGNAFDGTLTNFALTGATSNWIVSGATVTTTGNPLGGVFVSKLASVCSGGSYTFPDGSSQTNITAQTVQTSTLQTVSGCDSVITTTVSVNPTYSVNASASVCSGGSYTFPDGSSQTNITAQTVQTSTLQTMLGCDSVITTTVNVNPTYSVSISDSVCYGSSYTFPDGTVMNNITATTSYTNALQTVAGCDSVVVSNISIIGVDVSVTQNGSSLTANSTNGTFQWLDCTNGYAIINGETAQSFTPSVNGNYAVAVTTNGCTDTSACFSPSLHVNLLTAMPEQVIAYPNPTANTINISSTDIPLSIILQNAAGQIVMDAEVTGNTTQIDISKLQPGIYFAKVRLGKEVTKYLKIVKE